MEGLPLRTLGRFSSLRIILRRGEGRGAAMTQLRSIFVITYRPWGRGVEIQILLTN